jgi:hypothetical protein
MADEGTLATSAQTLLAIGQNASAAQILEANTNIWIKMAESLMSTDVDYDLVTNIAEFSAYQKQILALAASSKAAMIGINQDQSTWELALTQSKLNVLDNLYRESMDTIRKFAK